MTALSVNEQAEKLWPSWPAKALAPRKSRLVHATQFSGVSVQPKNLAGFESPRHTGKSGKGRQAILTRHHGTMREHTANFCSQPCGASEIRRPTHASERRDRNLRAA